MESIVFRIAEGNSDTPDVCSEDKGKDRVRDRSRGMDKGRLGRGRGIKMTKNPGNAGYSAINIKLYKMVIKLL